MTLLCLVVGCIIKAEYGGNLLNNIEEIIDVLRLEKHCEGGFYRRTYCSELDCFGGQGQSRKTMSSIYYLVTAELGFSALVRNQSDLMLYFHQGDPLTIVFVDTHGQVTEHVLGNDLSKGQRPQLLCPANVAKAYDLKGGQYALVSEALSPSFEYEDMYQLSLADIEYLPEVSQERLKSYVIDKIE